MKKHILLFAIIVSCISCGKKNDATNNNQNSNSTCTTPIALTKLNTMQLFPASYSLNQDISAAATDPNSDSIIAVLGATGLHPDFGTGINGIPFTLVCGSQAKVAITFRANSYDGNYGSESDPGPYPIPATAPIEGNGVGDSHVLVCDVENNILYELYNASKDPSDNGWQASSGAVFNLNAIPGRPAGYTSADAAGLAILPYLVRYDEVASGAISHAIRFTISKPHTYNGYVSPANHKVSGSGALGFSLPMGAHLRLKKNVDISGFSATNQVILAAMKKYGIVVADIGSDMYITGAPDDRWDDSDLHNLNKITAADFEVLQMGAIH